MKETFLHLLRSFTFPSLVCCEWLVFEWQIQFSHDVFLHVAFYVLLASICSCLFRHFASTILIPVLLLLNFCYLRWCWSHTVGLEVFCSRRFGVGWALSLRCWAEFTGGAIWACGFPCGISHYGFNAGNSIGWFQCSRSSNVSFRKLLKTFVHFFWCLKTALLTQQKNKNSFTAA